MSRPLEIPRYSSTDCCEFSNSWLVSLDEVLLRAGLLPAGTPSVSKGLWD